MQNIKIKEKRKGFVKLTEPQLNLLSAKDRTYLFIDHLIDEIVEIKDLFPFFDDQLDRDISHWIEDFDKETIDDMKTLTQLNNYIKDFNRRTVIMIVNIKEAAVRLTKEFFNQIEALDIEVEQVK